MFLLLSNSSFGFESHAADLKKRKLIAQAPQNVQPIQTDAPPQGLSAASTLKQGRQLIDMGRLQDALRTFQIYTGMKPQDASGYFWMAVCYDEMGNLPASTQAYRDSISRAEQNAMDSCEIRMNLGNVLLKQNEFDQAIENYKRALEVNPQYSLAELNLGRAYIAKGDFQSGLAALTKCEELHFAGPQLPYYKAKALMGLGRKDEAAVIVLRLLQDLPPGNHKISIQQEFQSCLPPPK
ncbi:MAG: tetratricopeptide repeat protein [Candidatus Obscuribacterales bacterium]|nr:tetratricopeptide repeat protein [Candidatus Obscuribacterales bacterium]